MKQTLVMIILHADRATVRLLVRVMHAKKIFSVVLDHAKSSVKRKPAVVKLIVRVRVRVMYLV